MIEQCSNKSVIYVLFTALIFSLCFVVLGILIGATNFNSLFSDVKWTDILSSLGSILAGLGTVFAASIAAVALYSWRHEFKWKETYNAYCDFEVAVEEYFKVTRDYSNLLCSNSAVSFGIYDEEDRVETDEVENEWLKFRSSAFKKMIKVKSLVSENDKKIISSKLNDFDDLVYKSLQVSSYGSGCDFDMFMDLKESSIKANNELEVTFFELRNLIWSKKQN